MIPAWKAKRGYHILQHYGSWQNAIQSGHMNQNGINIINLPPALQDIIRNDPECHPPEKETIWHKIFGRLTLYRKGTIK
jgi:hypothetical protein